VDVPVTALAGALVIAAVAVVPSEWLPAEPGEDVPGAWFGGRARDTVALQAGFVARHSRPEDVVATPEPWCAFVADRVELWRETPRGPVSRGWLVQSLNLRELALVMEPLEPLGELYDWDLRQSLYRRFTDGETGFVGWRPVHGWPHPQVRALERPLLRPMIDP
jgi:hypothetical protein